MLEWLDVTNTEFDNPTGETTQVKLIYEFTQANGSYLVDTNGRDLDLIASEELGIEASVLSIIENNAVMLSEYDWDMSKVVVLKIPV